MACTYLEPFFFEKNMTKVIVKLVLFSLPHLFFAWYDGSVVKKQ